MARRQCVQITVFSELYKQGTCVFNKTVDNKQTVKNIVMKSHKGNKCIKISLRTLVILNGDNKCERVNIETNDLQFISSGRADFGRILALGMTLSDALMI